MKKLYKTVIHASAADFDTIIFSGGKIGYQVELSLGLSVMILFFRRILRDMEAYKQEFIEFMLAWFPNFLKYRQIHGFRGFADFC